MNVFPAGEEIFNGYYDIEIWYKSRFGYYKYENVDKLYWNNNILYIYFYIKDSPGQKVVQFAIHKIKRMKYGTTGRMEKFKLSNFKNNSKLNKKIWRNICS